jgi:hypothetical protein
VMWSVDATGSMNICGLTTCEVSNKLTCEAQQPVGSPK